MATSPSFNWPEPDNTDLVKNGALAIRTAVDAIDTSMTDLLGGTTGQVLSKASATDMDFTWATPSNPTPKSFNYIINGGMDISQRGTSFVPTSGIYTLDRWFGQRYGGAGGTITQVNTSDTTNLPQITKAMRIANNAGTGTNNTNVFNSLESSQTQQLLGQTVTLSFYLRKGADYSGADFTVSLIGGTGTDQSLNSGYTGQATLATVTAVPSTTWTRYQTTLTLGSTYTQLGLVIVSKAVGTSGANDWAEITGVQLELGSTATPFQRAGGTIQGELAACQRYYYRQTSSTNAYTIFGVGGSASATQARFAISYPVTMRTTPTAVDFSSLGAAETGASVIAVTAASIDGANGLLVSIGSSSFTQYRNNFLYSNNSTSAYVGFSAEL